MSATLSKRLQMVFFLFLLLPTTVLAMGFLNKHIVFSAVDGIVTLQGKPLQNVKVTRSYSESKKIDEVTHTDSEGRFQFPDWVDTTLFDFSFLPMEIRIIQEIVIEHQGTQYDAWVSAKSDYEKNSELKGAPINLSCELSSEPNHKDTPSEQTVYGICSINL
ncbi:MAG: DUF4198 domain-containing protein [Candidatus Polarisedimenticolaceae bacterium]|nr:DUF4198 domain-containing protein [Candidatus Polarisedimenticolaceae bacterium]